MRLAANDSPNISDAFERTLSSISTSNPLSRANVQLSAQLVQISVQISAQLEISKLGRFSKRGGSTKLESTGPTRFRPSTSSLNKA